MDYPVTRCPICNRECFLRDGRSRVCFLCTRQIRMIPIKITVSVPNLTETVRLTMGMAMLLSDDRNIEPKGG